MTMKKMLAGAGLWVLGAAVASALPMEPGTARPDDEGVRAAITKAARDYVEGWYTADSERLERALHPDLNKVQVVRLKNGKDILARQSADILLNGRAGAKGEPEPPHVEVSILSVSGKTASVEIISPDFVDLAHVAEVNGAWVVVNVLWHVIEKEDGP